MQEKAFIEENCTIEFGGRSFSTGGSWICNCTDGKVRGVVYVDEASETVRTWHGAHIANAKLRNYQGNFCKMQRVSFTFAGVKFVGDYCPDWSQACKVRSTKKARIE